MTKAPQGEWKPMLADGRAYPGAFEYWIDGRMVAWLTQRPPYCDRGHWAINVELPDINGADAFPRYYMSRAVAVAETEAFIAWRLFKQRAS